jgi:hypothetical protein
MPWTVEPSYLDLCNVYDEDGKIIAANVPRERAYLIATAPEMLETLEMVLDDTVRYVGSIPGWKKRWSEVLVTITHAKEGLRPA